MFKKDEYIVTLIVAIGTHCAKNNYCFKQKRDSDYISPCLDLLGSKTNDNLSLIFDKSQNLKDWRYATEEEAEHYELIGKPYDVTTLSKFILPEKWCVKDTCDERSNGLYEYASIHGARPPYGPSTKSHYYHFPSFRHCTTMSNIENGYTEITLDQFLKYVLNKEPIKEDMTALIKLLEGL